MKTTVIFYMEQVGSENEPKFACLAVFPYEHEKVGVVECYSHIGQHSTASVEYCQSLKKATKKQYSDLKRELESYPYNYNLIVL